MDHADTSFTRLKPVLTAKKYLQDKNLDERLSCDCLRLRPSIMEVSVVKNLFSTIFSHFCSQMSAYGGP
jgi:hypothetical protein